MRRLASLPVVSLFTALVGVASCGGDPVSVDRESVGPEVAQYSLVAEDGSGLPCCARDSAATRITVIGGALRFYGPAGYADTVFTPAGPASRACVHGIPNGSFLDTRTHLVTLADGTSYLLLPCDRGSYTIVLTRRLDRADGSTGTDSVTVSAGAFTAKPDTVTLEDSANRNGVHTSVSGATIFVTVGYLYQFGGTAP